VNYPIESIARALKQINSAPLAKSLPILVHHIHCISVRDVLKDNEIVLELSTKVSQEFARPRDVTTRIQLSQHGQPFSNLRPFVVYLSKRDFSPFMMRPAIVD
jgi:hypothetical protein